MFCVYELNDKNGLFYIGKSEDLSQRIGGHKSDIKNGGTCSSRKLDINFEYKVLQEYENENDMTLGEQQWYDIYKEKYGDKCVNKCRPLNTSKESSKKYYQEHKEERKEYYQEHADHIKEQNIKYYQEHAEEKKEYQKKYNKETIDCECGLKIKRGNKLNHLKTTKHITLLNALKK